MQMCQMMSSGWTFKVENHNNSVMNNILLLSKGDLMHLGLNKNYRRSTLLEYFWTVDNTAVMRMNSLHQYSATMENCPDFYISANKQNESRLLRKKFVLGKKIPLIKVKRKENVGRRQLKKLHSSYLQFPQIKLN